VQQQQPQQRLATVGQVSGSHSYAGSLVPPRVANGSAELPAPAEKRHATASASTEFNRGASSRRPQPAPSALKGSRAGVAATSARPAPAFAEGSGREASTAAGASSASGSRAARERPQTAPAEPQLLVLRLLYLSRLQQSGWFEKPCRYLLSAHVGEEARADPPEQPGKLATRAVQAQPPQIVNPEEEALRQRVMKAIVAMIEERKKAGETVPDDRNSLECRFNERLAVRLSDVGPGPAAGGPAYFRVDVWVEQPVGLFGKDLRRQFFARIYVPLNDPRCQRRPCTWPAVDSTGKEIAYLTCEYAFVHAPPPVQDLQVERATCSEVSLTWSPPPADSIAPIVGYTLEACMLSRGNSSDPGQRNGQLPWQHVSDLPSSSSPEAVAKNLRGDTRYRFRVRAVSEAGLGEAAEVEGLTAPTAPGACGRLRISGCSGPVLTIEWDPPMDDGGSPVIVYRLWVRSYSASRADPSAWMEMGQVKHREGLVQRAEIHTEELDPRVSRYLCSVAAVNSAGEIGPATPDATALPFPNACAVCGPTPQKMPALMDWPVHANRGSSGGDFAWNAPQESGMPNVLLMPQGRREARVQLLPQSEDITGISRAYASNAESGGAMFESFHEVDSSWEDTFSAPEWGSVPRADTAAAAARALLTNMPGTAGPQPMTPPMMEYEEQPMMQAMDPSRGSADTVESKLRSPQQVREQCIATQRILKEKRRTLEASMARYLDLQGELARYPQDLELLRSHEEAEIEAAGHQAEVAVLAKRLSDLERLLADGQVLI